jgi:signal peptidase I
MKRVSPKATAGFGLTLLMVLAFAVFFNLNFKTVVVNGDSMQPTLRPGQRVLVSKAYWLIGQIRRKDIVVVQDDKPDGYFIKRVYRLPGEVVDYPNIPSTHTLASGDYVVPDGYVYVLGDNRAASEDSRTFGPIPYSKIIGKVVVR